MKKVTVLIISVIVFVTNIFAIDAKPEIEKAKKAGKAIFIVVTDKAAKGTDALLKMTDEVIKKNKNTACVKLDRDDKVNSELITKYRLAGASLPLVLVVASNGVISGSITAADATVNKLISFLPTKVQADVLFGFENGKAALIICGKKNAKDKVALESECTKALASLGNSAILVFVDVESKDEKNFLELIKPEMTKTTVLIFNGKGQYTGTLESTTKAAEIIKLVNKKAGGCAPGSCGSGKKC